MKSALRSKGYWIKASTFSEDEKAIDVRHESVMEIQFYSLVKILGETVRHVHAEAVRTMVEPEAQRLDEVGAQETVLSVERRTSWNSL